MRALTCPGTAVKIGSLLKRGNHNDTSEDHRHHNRHHPEYLVLWALPVLARPGKRLTQQSSARAYHPGQSANFLFEPGRLCVNPIGSIGTPNTLGVQAGALAR